LGSVLLALGQPQEAASAYQVVLLQDPEDTTAVEGLAQALLAAGDAEAALANYQLAADTAATPPARERWLMTLAAANRSLGRDAEAERIYQDMLAAGPQDAAAVHLALGDLYSTEDRLDDAIAQYRLATEAAPGSAQPAYRLGRIYLRTGAIDDAAALAQTLLERSPSAYESHLLQARVAFARGDESTALNELRQAANLAPTESAVQAQVGDLYLQASRPEDAVAAYTAAVTLNPRNASALTGLGRLLNQQGQVAEAETYLRRAAALTPNDVAVQAALGRLLLATGRAEESVALLEAAVAQRADHPTAVQDLADAYLGVGRIDEGLAIYRTRLALDAQQEPFVAARALLNAGQDAAALRGYRDIVAQRPNDPLALAALGQAYERTGQAADALASYDAALAADPQYAPASILKGNLLTALDRLDEATAVF
jgi:tetratricopeptide (TPR) repeat protein